jgi:hypothetical protein
MNGFARLLVTTTRCPPTVAGSSRCSPEVGVQELVDVGVLTSGLDDRVVAAVKNAGYLGATTRIYGLAHPEDPYRPAWARVNRSDGVDGFAAKLVALVKR